MPVHQHSRGRSRVAYLLLPVMLALLAGYVLIHSPIRRIVAMLMGRTTQACYFTCQNWVPDQAAISQGTASVLITVVCLSGLFVASSFRGAAYETPLVFGIATLALLSVPSAIIGGVASATGLPLLRPPLGPLLAAVPAIVVLAAGLRRGWRPGWQARWRIPTSPLVRLVGALSGVLLASSVIVGFRHPPSGWDPLSYHAPLAVYFWRDGDTSRFLDRAPDYAAWAHPGTTELWFGLLRIVGGEGLANVGQLPFAVLGACAVGAFARRLGLGQGSAALSGSIFLLVPLVVGQVEQQLNDVAAAGLLMASLALACAPIATWSRGRLCVLGLALGLMSATKLVLLPNVVALGAVVVVCACRDQRRWVSVGTAATRLAIVALVFLLVVSPWWVRNIARYGNPMYPAAISALGLSGLDQTTFAPRDTQYVGRGDTFGLPGGVAWLLYPLLESHTDQSGLGALLLVAALPGLVVAIACRRGQPLTMYAVTSLATIVGWWTLTRHDPRFLLGVGGLAFAFVPLAIMAVPRPQRRLASALVLLTALFSAAVTVDQELLVTGSFPLDRAAFYDRIWGLDPAIENLPESEPLVFERGDMWNADSLDYPLLGPSQSRLLFVLPHDSTTLSTNTIVERMRAVGAQYVYAAADDPTVAARIEAMYALPQFELSHFSLTRVVETRCCLEVHSSGGQLRRYLFRLRS